MRFLERGGRALAGEVQRLLAELRDRRLMLMLGVFTALLLLAAQVPLRYAIQVGQEDGPGSDLPLLNSFYTTEHDPRGDFRWTSAHATIQLPGIGQRSLQLTLRAFPVSPEVAERGPHEIEVWDGGQEIVRLPVRPAGATYRIMLPQPADGSGDHIVELRSATFVPSGDQRAIGAAFDTVYAAAGGPALPAWRSTLGWIGVAALAWLALRRAGFGPRPASALLLPGLALAGLAALLDPPRFALGAGPALIALALGFLLVLLLDAETPGLVLAGTVMAIAAGGWWALAGSPQPAEGISLGAAISGVAAALLLAGGLRPPLAALYRWLGPPIAPGARCWLILFALLVLALRYGGKIYPDSMPGDIGFHSNRYDALVRGSVLQLSVHRGVYFPYPPAFYLLLAPFSLLGLAQRVLLRLGGALLDALSPFLVYAIAASVSGETKGRGRRGARLQMPLVAAAIYAFSAAGFMATWWNFSTHIFTQFAHLLLITALVLIWRPALEDRRSTSAWARSSILDPRSLMFVMLVVLQSLVYLGHFGFWLNMSLLGTLALAALLWAALRGRAPWPAFGMALLYFGAAELLVVLLFYSDYAGQFLDQFRIAATSGLTGLAGRTSVDREVLWRTLWDAGLNAHLGFLPLPLALGGLMLLRQRTTDPAPPRFPSLSRGRAGDGQPTTENQRATHGSVLGQVPSGWFSVLILMAGTFAIGAVFAVLPFLSGSSLATRWLMFSLWAVAVGAALSLELLWRRGRAGRLLALVIGGYSAWITASMWLMALAWRVRPPEPF
jgi:hypothetical protein